MKIAALRIRVLAIAFALVLATSLTPLAALADSVTSENDANAQKIDLLDADSPLATIIPDGTDANRPAVFGSLVATGAIIGDRGAEKLQLGFDLVLDDAALQENAQAWIDDHPDFNSPDDLDAKLDSDASLAPVSFGFICTLSDGVQKPSGLTTEDIVITTGDKAEVIGHYTYEMVSGSTDRLKIKGSFLNHMYNRSAISAGQYFDLDLEAGHTGKPDLSLAPGSGTLDVSVDFIGGEPDDGIYAITKTAANRSKGDPNISYTIVAETDPSSAKADLARKTITDTLPAGLEFAGARNEAGNPLSEGDGEGLFRFDDATRTFTYLIPKDADNPTAKVARTAVTIDTFVSEDTYMGWLTGAAIEEMSFSNKASIAKPDDPAPLIESNPVQTTFGGSVNADKALEKSGKRKGVNGCEYEWTIKASAYLGGGRVWIVDRIEGVDSIHDYTRGADGIAYAIDSSSGTAAVIAPTQPVRFDDMTPEALDTITSNGTRAVSYAYDTDDDGVDDEAMLIIPLDDPAYRNKSVTLTYSTTVKADPAASGHNATIALKNDARIAWADAAYGIGPGTLTGSAPVFEVEKDVSSEFSLLGKTAGTYDRQTRELVWSIKLNLAGADLGTGEQTVIDTFDTDKQQIKSLQYRINGGSWTDVVLSSTDPGSTPRYEMQSDAASATTAAIITVSNVGTNLIEFRLTTTVIDPTALATQSNGTSTASPKAQNKATADLDIGGAVQTVVAEASKALPHTLLEKRAMKLDGATAGTQYDYANHLVTWQVTVNPDHVPISPKETGGSASELAALTDSLPEGTTFNELLSVKRIQADGAESDMSIAPLPASGPTTEAGITSSTGDDFAIKLTTASSTSAKGYSSDTATFSFSPSGTATALASQGEFTDSFVITFTTIIDGDYRTATFIDSSMSYTVTNKASLSGTVIGTAAGSAGVPHAAISANARADQIVKAQPLTKTGTYHSMDAAGNPYEATLGSVAYSSWTLVFNKHACDMETAVIEDVLPPLLRTRSRLSRHLKSDHRRRRISDSGRAARPRRARFAGAFCFV